jgi:hypothetical protein
MRHDSNGEEEEGREREGNQNVKPFLKHSVMAVR